MNPHQRDSRRAAELAFVESLAQLEEQLMADELGVHENSTELDSDDSASDAQSDDLQAEENSQSEKEAIAPPYSGSATVSSESFSKPTILNSRGKQPQQSSSKSKHVQPSTHRDSFQAFAEAAEDIERFIQSQR